MTLQDEIKELVLSFFQKIGSKIIENDGVYEIHIPKEYQDSFQAEQILFSFDEKIASKKNIQLVIPGSNILSLVITNCKQRGSISLKKSKTNTGDMVIRYHFFVDFSGISHISKLDYVDVNLNTLQYAAISDTLEDADFLLDDKINAKNITPSYLVALNSIKERHSETRTNFLSDANKQFQQDFKIFVEKYDSQMRELDNAINKKEENSDDFEKIQKFRFNTIDEIKELEKEKTQLIETLQEKHKISLEYNLIACEIVAI